MGLWLRVSARSGGLRARVHSGSGGLLERKCEEKGRTKSAKEKLWEHCEELFRSILEEKSEKGEHRPHKSVQEILRGFEYDQKYSFFLVLAVLGAVRRGFGRIPEAF